jgi:tRNA 5-methylaminomethyl-2-thiouridine biosynthesis bifunctional protein
MTDDRSPHLIWTPEGAPRSGRFDDVYFSREDGLAESRAVFLTGCGLPETWRGRHGFTVGELGFGTGLNIAALLDLWRHEGPADGRLHVFSIEGFPLSRDEAAQALAAWPDIAEASQALLDAWPSGTPGFHRLDLPAFRATLDLAVGEAEWALAQWRGRADAWFLDGFAPSTNPAMWSDAVLDGVRTCSAPGARLASFTVAGVVRRGLAERGFTVEKRPGHGRKRERLEARLPGEATEAPDGPVIVIGAGIAGAAAARALRALGRQVAVVETEAPGAGGSGFPTGLVTPRLDAGDAGIAALHAQALSRAGTLYRRIKGAVMAEGVLQLQGAPRDAARFDKVAAQAVWPEGTMRALDAAQAGTLLGEVSSTGGLHMAYALAVRPRAVLDAWLDEVPIIPGRVDRIETSTTGWRLLDADGGLAAEAAQVVIAAGWGSDALAPALGLKPVRGQADWISGVAPPGAVAWGGYVVPTSDGLLFGATHDRGDVATDTRPDSTADNRRRLAERLPDLAARIAGLESRSRAAVRATTADRLPLVGEIAPGLFVLTGLGSRGLCLAPLLGEHLAATMSGTPSPLPGGLVTRIDPTRVTQPTARSNARV